MFNNSRLVYLLYYHIKGPSNKVYYILAFLLISRLEICKFLEINKNQSISHMFMCLMAVLDQPTSRNNA